MILKENRQINELVLILVGKFNPVIIQPYWMAYKGLIREEEGKNAKIEFIHNELVKFDLEWIKVQVTRDRFELRTTQEPYFEPLKDLAVGILKYLSETPMDSFGINYLRHYILASEQEYYEFGNKLAPLANWKELAKDPRVLNVEILLYKNGNDLARVRIQPSDSLKDTKYAFMINSNHHFTSDLPVAQKNEHLRKILVENWQSTGEFVDQIELHVQKLLGK